MEQIKQMWKSTVTKEAYANMKAGFPKKKK